MKKEKHKKGIINQVLWPLVTFFIITAIVTQSILVGFFFVSYVKNRGKYTYGIAKHTADIFEEYKAIGWLVPFWHEHYDDMDFVYDDAGQSLKEEEFKGRTGMANITEVTEEQISSRPYADQLLFAEAVYADCSMTLDQIKRSFELVYSYSLIKEDNDLFFIVTGTREGEKRASQGGDLYELGSREPYTEGTYQVFEKLAETGKPVTDFEALTNLGGDRNGLVHMYAPVHDEDGNMVMIAAASLPWIDFIFYVRHAWTVVFPVTLLLLFLLLLWVRYFLKKVVIKPVNSEQQLITEYGNDKDAEKALNRLSAIRSNNEIESLAEDFSEMIAQIDKYALEIRTMTAEKERTETEMANAAQIQKATLPTAFPKRKEFDLYAMMESAKEVGGDFYDFFFLDETHFFLLVGDVSGKGMPGALFMMTAKALLKTRALQGGSFSEILNDVNGQLLEINQSNMFVTVWMAAIDITTGNGFASNAGHTDSVIRRAGGEYELVRYRHDPLIGIVPVKIFNSHPISLSPGDSFFIYTDGVSEAVNSEDELYGEERMLEALNRHKEEDMKGLLGAVKEEIEKYAEGVDQYDDITMMGFRFFGRDSRE